MIRFIRDCILILLLSGIVFTSTGYAHCKAWHPHHCVEDAAEAVYDGAKDVAGAVYGGAKKRAKMVWDDPLGSALNPIKIIDESIPSPLSFSEYIIKNPNEIVEILKNPAAGVVGAPLAMIIADSRNSALKNGTLPIPDDVREYLSPFFSDSLLNSVRYTSDPGYFNGIAQALTLKTTASAVTLVNVVAFKNKTGGSSPESIRLWAHELYHVKQYRDMGLLEFAATLTLTGAWGKDGNIERPAYRFDRRFANAIDRYNQSTPLSGSYTIQQASSKRYVDAHEEASNDYNVVTRKRQKNDSQAWVFESAGRNRYRIKQKNTARYLDAHENPQNDFQLVTRPRQSNDTQIWQVVKDTQMGQWQFTVQQMSNNRSVDAHEHQGNDYGVVTRNRQNNSTQRWIIVPKSL